jgi:hypothetical protein
MSLSSLRDFCAWLADTPVSHTFQEVLWIVPAAQSIHILTIAIAMSALLMIHLRSIGVLARAQSRLEVADRFLPALWIALPVLLATGAVLIVAEPARSLRAPRQRCAYDSRDQRDAHDFHEHCNRQPSCGKGRSADVI